MKLSAAIPLHKGNDPFISWAPDPGFHFGAEECPWIPGDPGSWNKFMLLDLRRNALITLFKIDPGYSLPTHYHTGPVVGYVLQGTWKYKEYEWVAGSGSTIYEPPGEVHTLENIGDDQMISFFYVQGPEITVDDDGRQVRYFDTYSHLSLLRKYCEENNVDESFIEKITR